MKRIWKKSVIMVIAVTILRTFLPSAAALSSGSATVDFSVDNYKSFIETVARQYIERDTEFTIRYTASLSEVQNSIKNNSRLWDDIFSVDIPGTTSDLDYLHNNMSQMHISYIYSGTSAVCELTQTYLTSSVQEKYVNSAVSAALEALDIDDSTTYGKVKAIHNYIIGLVDYDKTLSKFSAYDALYSRSAVCQGYALLMYKMLTEAGVPARIISGEAAAGGSRGPHAWNIVKIGRYWYNVDVTWDDSYNTDRYFLKSNAGFSDHFRDSELDTAAFNVTHPMAPNDFSPAENAEPESAAVALTADVPEVPNTWAAEYVSALNARGIIPPELNAHFRDGITRAEFMALIANVIRYVKGSGSPQGVIPFADISGSPYQDHIALCYQLGIIEGDGNLFRPENTLTREQCAKIIAGAVKAINGGSILSNDPLPYKDAHLISNWALPYVRYAYETGLMQGSDGYFNPQGVLSREQAMTVIERMIRKYGW
jgi:hypothetical protein